MIAMGRGQETKRSAAISRAIQTGVQDIDGVGRFRISINFAEIPCPLPETAIIVHAGPMISAVVGSVKAAGLSFDQGIDSIGIKTRNGNSDPSKDPVWQPIPFEALPGLATING